MAKGQWWIPGEDCTMCGEALLLHWPCNKDTAPEAGLNLLIVHNGAGATVCVHWCIHAFIHVSTCALVHVHSVMWCDVMWCDVMWCGVMLCYVHVDGELCPAPSLLNGQQRDIPQCSAGVHRFCCCSARGNSQSNHNLHCHWCNEKCHLPYGTPIL